MVSVMPLAEFKAKFAPVYPGEEPTWDDTVQYMLNDPIEGEIVQLLVDYLAKDGKFREPVYTGIGVRYIENEGKTEELDIDIVSNGTHRMVAMILNGNETVEYTYKDDPEYVDPWNELPLILTRVQFEGLLDEAGTDILMDTFRSFPISENEWVTSDLMVGAGNDFTMYYGGAEPNEENYHAIARIIKEKLAGLGYNEDTVTIEMTLSDDDDEGENWIKH